MRHSEKPIHFWIRPCHPPARQRHPRASPRQDAAIHGTATSPAAAFFLTGGENAVAGGPALPTADPRRPFTRPLLSLSSRRNSPAAERAWPQALPTGCARRCRAAGTHSQPPARPGRSSSAPGRAGPPAQPPGAPEGASPARAPRRRSPTAGSGGSPRSPARC